MKLNKKQEIIAATILGGVFFLLTGRFLISGLYSNLTGLHQQIKLAEAQLKEGLRVQKNKDKISLDYKKSKPYLKVVKENERQILAELLKEIERLMSSVDGAIISLTPQESPDTEEVFKEYKVNFRVEVSFPQLLHFLSKVQKNKRLIKFEKMTITAQGDDADVLRVQGVISLAALLK